MGELGGAAEAAVPGIALLDEPGDRLADHVGAGLRPLREGLRPQRSGDLGGGPLDVGAAVPEGVVGGLEDGGKAGHAPARLGGEVGAAEEGGPAGGQEDGHRPAPLAGDGLDRLHVDRVEVGALLAIDLDVDEELVHQSGDPSVLEELVGHDVAPVAGAVADREQDRAVGLPRDPQRLLSPGIPVDRVAGVLPEVGAGLGRQAVGHGAGVRRGGAGRRRPARRRTSRRRTEGRRRCRRRAATTRHQTTSRRRRPRRRRGRRLSWRTRAQELPG